MHTALNDVKTSDDNDDDDDAIKYFLLKKITLTPSLA